MLKSFTKLCKCMSTLTMYAKQKIVAFGNPLLDTIVNITENSLLEKYKVKEDGQKEITEEEMFQLCEDISRYERHESAGGCSQNMLRVLQWMTGKQCEAHIFGSVGKDPQAHILRDLLQRDGVSTKYIEQDLPTGRTVSLVNVPKRTLLAYIGAAEVLPLNDLLNHKEFETLVSATGIVYIEAFFLTNRIETAKHVLEISRNKNKTVLFNLCGEYIFEVIPETIAYFAENANVVFGNKAEFLALQRHLKIESFEKLINVMMSSIEEKWIIITDGGRPVKCYHGVGVLTLVEPEKIPQSDIKDTTGAGDAFVGGFIAGLSLNKGVVECAKLGNYAAGNIIKEIGCTLPKNEPRIFT